MKLTRRGLVVVVLIGTSILLGAWFGSRGLNAIAAPAAVALVAAVVQVKRFDRPTAERELPAQVSRGETARVRLHLSTETPFSAHVHDAVDEGLDAADNERDTTIGHTTLQYDIYPRTRGEHGVGPATVRARDVLGLVTETYRYPTRDELLVRPRVYPLAGPRRDDIVWLYGGAGDERGQFDQLRLYRRGDPVRDIHWKSSAKQPGDELVVLEFTADEGANTIEIAAEADPGRGDEMADAAASIAAHLIEAGVNVGLVTPRGRLDPDEGAAQHDRILDYLARAESGDLSERDRRRAQIVVEATADGVSVDIEGRTFPFAEVAGTDLGTADGSWTRRGVAVA